MFLSMQAAALALQQEADKWEDENNAIVRVAKTMATQMFEMSKYSRRTSSAEVNIASCRVYFFCLSFYRCINYVE